MADKEGQELTLIVLILFIGCGVLVIPVVAVFIKRQIVRFALKSKSGQYIRIGHDVRKNMKREIRRRMNRTSEISHEPNLLHIDAIKHSTTSDDHENIPQLYRMKALDSCKILQGQLTTRLNTRVAESFDHFLRDSIRLIQANMYERKVHELCTLYRHARHEPKEFSKDHFKKTLALVTELSNAVQRSRQGNNQFIRPIADINELPDDDTAGRRVQTQFKLPLRQAVLHLAGKMFKSKKAAQEYQSVPSTESLDEIDETTRL